MTQKTNKYFVIYSNIFSQKDWVRFGCQHFHDRGYEVVPVEFIPQDSEDRFDGSSNNDYASIDNAIRLKTDIEVDHFMKAIKSSDLLVLMINLKSETRVLFEKITKYDVNYAVCSLGQIPTRRHFRLGYTNYLKKWREILEETRTNIRNYKYFLERLFGSESKWIELKGPKWYIKAGCTKTTHLKRAPKLWQAEIISVRTQDAEVAQQCMESPRLIEKPYAVFLDQRLWDHPDIAVGKNKGFVTKEKYLPAINKLFDKIEKELGLEVVIAAHPKAPKDDKPYGERQSIKGKSALLVRDADLVISSYSTALAFAVIFRKNLLLCTSEELKTHLITGPCIARMSSWLDSEPLNLDSDSAIQAYQIQRTDPYYFDKYYQNFIADKTASSKHIWEFVAETFEFSTIKK